MKTSDYLVHEQNALLVDVRRMLADLHDLTLLSSAQQGVLCREIVKYVEELFATIDEHGVVPTEWVRAVETSACGAPDVGDPVVFRDDNDVLVHGCVYQIIGGDVAYVKLLSGGSVSRARSELCKTEL